MGRNIPTRAANSELAIVPFASLADRPAASVFGEGNYQIITPQYTIFGYSNGVEWYSQGHSASLSDRPSAATFGKGVWQVGSAVYFSDELNWRSQSEISVVANGCVRFDPPSQVNWWDETYPLEFYKKPDGTFDVSLRPRDVVDQRIFTDSAQVYYVNVNTGNDSNDGLANTTPLKSIHAAITKLNAATAACGRIYVAAGTYGNANGWTGSSTAVRLTKPCAFIATGPVITHSGVDLTWSLHSGATYKATRNQVGFVLENYTTELTNVADVATCEATAGSWVESGGVVYVHRSDGAAVTNANTRVILWINSALFDATSSDVYFDGFEFQGGRYGALDLTDGPTTRTFTRNVGIENCTMHYAGYPAARAPGLAVDRFSGVVCLRNSTATKNSSDGFNYHANGNVTVSILEVKCSGSDNGRYGETSANASSGHENANAIIVEPTHASALGASVHFIQTSHAYILGGSIECTDANAPSACVKQDNTASIIIDQCEITGSGAGGKTLYNNGTGALYKRNVTTVIGVESGTVTGI
jgi:hypothetical protein